MTEERGEGGDGPASANPDPADGGDGAAPGTPEPPGDEGGTSEPTGPPAEGEGSDPETADPAAADEGSAPETPDPAAADEGAAEPPDPAGNGAETGDGAGVGEMTVNVGIVTALVLTPLVWVLLEGLLTVLGHHPGSWQLRLATVGVTNLLFWVALGVDESREDDWVGLAAVGWLLVLLPLWLLTEAAVVLLDLTALAGVEQTGLRLVVSGTSAVLFGLLLDRRRGG